MGHDRACERCEINKVDGGLVLRPNGYTRLFCSLDGANDSKSSIIQHDVS